MHSPRQKKPKSGQAGIEPIARPTHSRLGNPYPQGLEPVVLDDGDITDLERQGEPEPPGPGCLVTDEYLYVPPDPKWPRLKLQMARQRPGETDAQYEAYRRDMEQHTSNHCLLLCLCQLLSTHLGNHLTCPEGLCRRNGACSAVRDQDREPLSLLVYPPCVPLDREITETYRKEIIAEIRRVVARGK